MSTRTRQRPAWTLVAGREIKVRLSDKTFLITTGFTVFMLVAIFGVQAFVAANSGSDYTVAVTNDEGEAIVQAAEPAVVAEDDDSTLSAQTVPDRTAGEQLVRDEEVDALLIQTDENWELISLESPPSDLSYALQSAVQISGLEATAAELDTTVPELLTGTELVGVLLDSDGNEVVYVIASLAFAFLFYFAAIMFGMTIATSVVEEKQSRIVEILAAIIPTRALLTGKVVGNTVLAMAQLILLVGVALIGLSFTDVSLAIPGLTEAILWYIPFFLAGFLALACIWAAVGAMASRNEDLQSSTMPLTMVLIVAFLGSIWLDGVAAQIASYVPIISTLMMPGRVLTGDATWFDPLIALVLVIGFAALTVLVGEKLYRRSLLQTQGRVSYRQALKLGD